MDQFNRKLEETPILYYNTALAHNPNDGYAPTLAQSIDTKTTPIIQNMEDYFLSVISFSFPAGLLPLYIFPIAPYPNTNPNVSSCIVTLEYNGVYVNSSLLYTGSFYPQPAGPSITHPQPNITEYYFCYEYQTLLTAFNTAFNNCMVGLGAPIGSSPPIMTFDNLNQRTGIIVDRQYYDPTLTATPINVYFNIDCKRWTLGLPIQQLNNNNLNQRAGKLTVVARSENDFYYPPLTNLTVTAGLYTQKCSPPYFRFYSEFETLAAWNGVQQVYISSTLLENIPEYTINAPLAQANSNMNGIIASFIPLLNLPGELRSVLNYNRIDSHRLISLRGHGRIQRIDIT